MFRLAKQKLFHLHCVETYTAESPYVWRWRSPSIIQNFITNFESLFENKEDAL